MLTKVDEAVFHFIKQSPKNNRDLLREFSYLTREDVQRAIKKLINASLITVDEGVFSAKEGQ